MTLRLILIRHAKSSWDNHRIDDHDRPLNDRGRENAAAVGQWLAARGYVPKEVLCSTAKRTRETWALIAAKMPAKARVEFLPELYHASADEMLSTLGQARESVVAIVAHNPGSAALAAELGTEPHDHPRFFDYPTCATTVIDFPASRWRDVELGSGNIVDFAVPKELD